MKEHAPITPEERAELRKNWKKRLEQIMIARDAIVNDGRNTGNIDCPVCKTGKLHFSVAKSNGHVHAKCTTRLCMSWME